MNDVFFSPKELDEENDENERLLKINCGEEHFEFILNSYGIDDNENICTKNSTWFSFKGTKVDEKPFKYKITEGDIIKIGRIVTRIKKISYHNNNTDFKGGSDGIANHYQSIKEGGGQNITNKKKTLVRNERLIEISKDDIKSLRSEEAESKGGNISIANSSIIKDNNNNKASSRVCRICYGEEDTASNPLVQPCKCSGSMKYIHLTCLKQWLNTSRCIKVESNENCSIFLVKQVECELCKTKFPDLIKHHGKLYHILDFDSEFPNSLVLESLTLDKKKNKFIYVISLDKNKQLKIGRGHDSNILLSDISVSRIHSIMTIQNKNVYIEDNNSKFGTLILVQTPTIRMVEGLALNIQVGRTFIRCNVKRPFKIFGCCGSLEKPSMNYYHRQNEKKIDEFKLTSARTVISLDDEDEDNNCYEEESFKKNEEGGEGQEREIVLDNDEEKNKQIEKISKLVDKNEGEESKIMNNNIHNYGSGEIIEIDSIEPRGNKKLEDIEVKNEI